MSVTKKETWQEYLPVYEELKQKLAEAGWFEEGWKFEAEEQPAFSSVTGQLYREGWFNEGRGGIHFDSSIGQKQIEEGVVSIMLHCHKDFPRPAEFCKLIAQRCANLATKLEGCTLSETSSFQPLVISLPFTNETLLPQLEKGFNEVKPLLPLIEQCIVDALKN